MTKLRFYRNTCGFSLLAIASALLVKTIGEGDYTFSLLMAICAIGDAWETTKMLARWYRIDMREKKRRQRRAA